jgi:hypothetical protein
LPFVSPSGLYAPNDLPCVINKRRSAFLPRLRGATHRIVRKYMWTMYTYTSKNMLAHTRSSLSCQHLICFWTCRKAAALDGVYHFPTAHYVHLNGDICIFIALQYFSVRLRRDEVLLSSMHVYLMYQKTMGLFKIWREKTGSAASLWAFSFCRSLREIENGRLYKALSDVEQIGRGKCADILSDHVILPFSVDQIGLIPYSWEDAI